MTRFCGPKDGETTTFLATMRRNARNATLMLPGYTLRHTTHVVHIRPDRPHLRGRQADQSGTSARAPVSPPLRKTSTPPNPRS
ncbi:hypothetical protein GCM10022224_056640 [Nonomuraea antimicrobica]|uniref:Uncharacterized protein n=1 Tax=Nonomuraea antimicrobica TaxID=561173 RepID=A0ABP7CDR5_9ACTN